MTKPPASLPWFRATGGVVVLALALGIGTAAPAQELLVPPGEAPRLLDPAVQQSGGEIPSPPPAAPAGAPAGNASGIVQTGCTNCGAGLLGQPDYPDHIPQLGGNGCASSPCVPGRRPCSPCYMDSYLGKCICGVYDCICCPDPCYEGKWIPIADAAFFVESVRPKSQQRLRWDAGLNLILPDRSEFFWARADGQGKGPSPTPPFFITPGLAYNEISLYTEAAVGGFAMITEFPYRQFIATDGPSASGFGDMVIGTKSLLFDCELLQLGFLFKTFIPIGLPSRGLGVGHTSLEFSVLLDVKLAKETYFESQVSEWVPISGDPAYAGSLMHFHASINQVLFRAMPNVPLIGTLEMNGYTFQSGQFTDPVLGPGQSSSSEMYLSPGFGLRLFVCDKIDFGAAAAFAVTQRHFAEQLYRFEFRWRL